MRHAPPILIAAVALLAVLSVPRAGLSAPSGEDAAPGDSTAQVDVAAAPERPGMTPENLARVRAAFLFQVLRFTRWPESRFDDGEADDEGGAGGPTAPIIVGVPRGSAITPVLLTRFRGRTIGERPIELRELDLEPVAPGGAAVPEADAALVDAAIAQCHVVYVPGRNDSMVRRVWPVARRSHLLVVADDDRAMQHGAALVLPVTGQTVKLTVNRTCLEASGVGLSSRVMKLATVVEQEVRP